MSARPTAQIPRVLVIDDEPAVGQAIARILRKEAVVVPETDARRALLRLAGGEHYDVILCDVMMPGMTGMDFLAEVRRQHASLVDRVQFMTGGAFSARALEFVEALGGTVLLKPVNTASLRAFVSTKVATPQ